MRDRADDDDAGGHFITQRDLRERQSRLSRRPSSNHSFATTQYAAAPFEIETQRECEDQRRDGEQPPFAAAATSRARQPRSPPVCGSRSVCRSCPEQMVVTDPSVPTAGNRRMRANEVTACAARQHQSTRDSHP